MFSISELTIIKVQKTDNKQRSMHMRKKKSKNSFSCVSEKDLVRAGLRNAADLTKNIEHEDYIP